MKATTRRAEVWMRVTTLVLGLLIARTAFGQTMVTADTLGKGKIAGFAAVNALAVKDFTTLGLSMAQIWYGVNNRTDAFAGISDTVVFGQHQAALMAGGNLNLLKSKQVSVSTFHAVSAPFTRRTDACRAMWFASVVASRSFGKLTAYTGYSANIPLGNTADKLFTPAETVHNLPLGVFIPKGKWGYFVEYNYGPKVQAFGLGISFAP